MSAAPTIDFADPAFRRDPYPTFHRLRTHDPVHFRPGHDDWVLTRYADIAAVLRDRRFGARLRNMKPLGWRDAVGGAGPDRLQRMLRASDGLVGLWMVTCNPPEHTRLRELAAPAFAPERVAALRPVVESIVEELLDRVAGAPEVDLISALAYPLPVAVITRIMGVPVDERFETWSRDITGMLDLSPPPAHTRGQFAIAGLAAHLHAYVEARRGALGGLIETLVSARDRGALHDDELLATASMLLFAGHETTRHLIGNGVLALLRHPEQLARLRAEPALLPAAIEEFLRFESPGQLVWRVALEDVEIGGKPMQRGAVVRVLLGAANRDPEEFAEPDCLDIGRRPNPHLAFGAGIHHCTGTGLARMEAAVAIAAILRRYPRLALAAEPLWEPTFRLRGLRTLRLAV